MAAQKASEFGFKISNGLYWNANQIWRRKNITPYKKQDYLYEVTIFDRFPSKWVQTYSFLWWLLGQRSFVKIIKYVICILVLGIFLQHFDFEPYGVFLKFPAHPFIWFSNTIMLTETKNHLWFYTLFESLFITEMCYGGLVTVSHVLKISHLFGSTFHFDSFIKLLLDRNFLHFRQRAISFQKRVFLQVILLFWEKLILRAHKNIKLSNFVRLKNLQRSSLIYYTVTEINIIILNITYRQLDRQLN